MTAVVEVVEEQEVVEVAQGSNAVIIMSAAIVCVETFVRMIMVLTVSL